MTVHSARIGDIVICRAPDTIEALALGSCVAVFIYDGESKVGGCAHVLLPSSSQFSASIDLEHKPGKYADLAIPALISQLITKGAKRDRLKAKIAGGAKMFESINLNISALDVGARNIVAVKEILQTNQVPVVSEDIGADYGRTVSFEIEKSVLTIKIGLQKIIRHI